VLAGPGEAQRPGQLEVAPQCRDVGRGGAGVGPVALVEHQPQRRGAAVDQQPPVADLDRAQRGVALDLVEHLAAVGDQGQLGVQQHRVGDGPPDQPVAVVDAAVPHLDGALDDVAVHPHRVVHQQPVAGAQPQVQPGAGDADGEPHAEVDPQRARVPAPLDVGDVPRRHLLQPDRAPDAGRARVPDVVRLVPPVLLPARRLEVERVVIGADHQLGAVVPQEVGDIDAERRVAALVGSHVRAADPHVADAVDGAEVQDGAPVAGAAGQPAAVPGAVEPPGPVHAAGRGLRGVGHPDGAVERDAADGAGEVGVGRELPLPVERGPGTAQQRSGVLGRVRVLHGPTSPEDRPARSPRTTTGSPGCSREHPDDPVVIG
jgi:hypothetical protein